MLCESCHQREATCHLTSILGDLMHKRDLCQGCFEALSPGAGTVAAAASRCDYCGGQAFSEATDVLGLLTGVEQTRFMCMPCNTKFQRYTLQELGALPEGLSHEEQLNALRSLRDRRDAHMRQGGVPKRVSMTTHSWPVQWTVGFRLSPIPRALAPPPLTRDVVMASRI